MMIPPMQPVLDDGLVLLRPLCAADWDALFAAASDPLIWALHPAHDRWKESVFREFFDEGVASQGALAIVDKANGAVIGSSRYDIRVCDSGEVEIGWTFLARSYWGGAWNRAIKRLMIAQAFASEFDRVIFLVGETNLRSRRALEKIGARLTDRRQRWDMAGSDIDHLIYAIDAKEFASGPLNRP
ncbi:MAG: GNAT family N-acetyltransferase [Sphingomonadaceae bacterium]